MLKPSPNGHLLCPLSSPDIFLRATEIRDTRWFWRRSKTPLQWMLCFSLGTQPSGEPSSVICLLSLSLPPHVPHILHHIRTSGYTYGDPHHNKGLAFREGERCPLLTLMHNFRQYKVPLQSEASNSLQLCLHLYFAERNERLFYKLLIDNVEELLPLVYTPTVGEACKYGSIFMRPRGIYISLKEKERYEMLKNWPERSIQVIVVTNGERFWGLGILATKYMLVPLVLKSLLIPMGKLSLYTTLYGLHPSRKIYDLCFFCLPVTIDVGINNKQCATSVVLAGLIASLKLVGGSLAAIGIAELIALEISKQYRLLALIAQLEETCKKIWLANSKVVET
ncbi:hypothetical protein AAG906_013738 [Vitis piasezkii]